MEDSLFDQAPESKQVPRNQGAGVPLAARMRPRSLQDYSGQEHILGEGKLLRRAIEADRFSSLIFYGPPGVALENQNQADARAKAEVEADARADPVASAFAGPPVRTRAP